MEKFEISCCSSKVMARSLDEHREGGIPSKTNKKGSVCLNK